MSRIFGVDLGTNSLGWSIREQDQEERKYYFETYLKSIGVDFDPYDEIVDYGVVIFKKGVGEGKSGEFSLAAERRTNRSKRRLYNAKRYRKWATLLELSKNGMCPISEEEIRLWSIGNWQDDKNKGRVYPTSFDFIAWLAMDFDRIGQDLDVKVKLKPAYANPYELRADLLQNRNDIDATRLYKIGRAFYHLVQRRGFKTSRKSGNTSHANNELFKKFKEEHPDKTNWKPSQIYLYLQSGKDPNPELRKERIRNNAVIQRGLNEDEFFTICKKQDINEVLANKIHKAIYYVRPLRTQKGLVGKCTLEKGKPRIPISNPLFEEFRALAFINNLQWREVNTKKVFEPIPIGLKKQILEKLFFKRLEKGKNKGKVDESGTLDFNDIIKAFSDKGKYEFNFRNKPTISTCPVIAGLMNVFDKEWEDKFIVTETEYGINWHGLALAYDTKYNGIVFKNKKLNYEEIWHLLFDYLQTKDDVEGLKDFCQSVLQWDDEKTTNFIEINISQGYGSLSRSAIDKIIPFLQQGFIYSEAVSFANLSKVLGKEAFEKNKLEITKTISDTIKGIDARKEKLNIVNSLIQAYFAEATTNRAKGFNGTIEEISVYKSEVIATLTKYFGETNWKEKSEELKQDYADFILDKYLTFISGKQSKEEKASAGLNKNPEFDYYKLPRLDEAIKQTLKAKFNATETGLKKLYHPSDIDIYPKAKNNWLEDPNPPSKGWKNPMAMRTMYELRKLINYLLEVGKINRETKIVVEMARELTTINQRKAIEDWNKDREEENKEYASAIAEIYGITSPSDEDYNKFRAAIEQITNLEFSENKESQFKKKYQEFVDIFLKGSVKATEENGDENFETENETNSYDYLMYLILTRDKFSQLLNSKIPNSQKFIRQIIKTSKDYKNKRDALKELLTKYRLWKQQKYQCFYTGELISISQLFSTSYQIEHTIPRSISFDSELKNLSVCDASYNNYEKKNKFPTECKNYYQGAICKTVNGDKLCSPIEVRVNRLILPKVDELKARIKNLTAISKKIKDWEVDKKNANIRLRHYLQFELDYWEKKLLTFTVEKKDWKDKWKNSQLVDTQIISKYARAYLKSLFNKVDVQKGSITAEFRNIYGIMGDEKKDRGKHSHHAKDAAVLTLIPGSAKREEILKKYYLAKENGRKHQEIPYKDFRVSHILKIETTVLVNHISKDQTLSETRKNLRTRGKIEYYKDENGKPVYQYDKEGNLLYKKDKDGYYVLNKNGNKIPLKKYKKIEGDSIRGQLHDTTYYGAIKITEKNKHGYPLKDNSKFVLKQKDGSDEISLVKREAIQDADLENMVDLILKEHIQKQLKRGKRITEVVDFNNKTIRRVRCIVKGLTPKKALYFKNHTFLSNHTHKQQYIARNTPGSNYLNIIYEGRNSKEEIIRAYRIISLFEFSGLGYTNIIELKNDIAYNTTIKGKGKNSVQLTIKKILRVGDRLLMWDKNAEELKDIPQEEKIKRLYKVYKFNNQGSDYNYLQYHLEARPDKDLGDGDTLFNPQKYQPRLKLNAENFNCLIEGIDFEIKPDGTIIFIKH